MILAFAGRRVDADANSGGVSRRFPPDNVPRVTQRIQCALAELKPSTVVGSAACGADLLVLEAAGALGVRRRIILPFARAAFRASSVTDRPGDWGHRFDAVIEEVTLKGDVVELALDVTDDATYQTVNQDIFRDAETLARSTGEECRVLVIWNRTTRGSGDVTAAFLAEADRRKWATTIIDTAN
jgi:hypothetical protein